MSGFNDFMDKAGVLAVKAAEKAKDLANVAAEKTKQVSRVAKLNMDISAQRDTIKKAYAELGRLYYEAHREDPDGALAQVCQEIDMAQAAIKNLEEEIAAIKAEEAQDGDFASVVDATAAEADVEVEVTVEEPAAPAEPAQEPDDPFTAPETPAAEKEDVPADDGEQP